MIVSSVKNKQIQDSSLMKLNTGGSSSSSPAAYSSSRTTQQSLMQYNIYRNEDYNWFENLLARWNTTRILLFIIAPNHFYYC